MTLIPLEQIEPLTRGETQKLVESAVRAALFQATFTIPAGESADATLRRAVAESRNREPFPLHLWHRIPGDFAYMIASVTMPLTGLYSLSSADPDILLHLALTWERQIDLLPEDHFIVCVRLRVALILRDLYAAEQAAMGELDDLTRDGRGVNDV